MQNFVADTVQVLIPEPTSILVISSSRNLLVRATHGEHPCFDSNKPFLRLSHRAGTRPTHPALFAQITFIGCAIAVIIDPIARLIWKRSTPLTCIQGKLFIDGTIAIIVHVVADFIHRIALYGIADESVQCAYGESIRCTRADPNRARITLLITHSITIIIETITDLFSRHSDGGVTLSCTIDAHEQPFGFAAPYALKTSTGGFVLLTVAVVVQAITHLLPWNTWSRVALRCAIITTDHLTSP